MNLPQITQITQKHTSDAPAFIPAACSLPSAFCFLFCFYAHCIVFNVATQNLASRNEAIIAVSFGMMIEAKISEAATVTA